MATSQDILEALADYQVQCNENKRLRKMQRDWSKLLHGVIERVQHKVDFFGRDHQRRHETAYAGIIPRIDGDDAPFRHFFCQPGTDGFVGILEPHHEALLAHFEEKRRIFFQERVEPGPESLAHLFGVIGKVVLLYVFDDRHAHDAAEIGTAEGREVDERVGNEKVLDILLEYGCRNGVDAAA